MLHRVNTNQVTGKDETLLCAALSCSDDRCRSSSVTDWRHLTSAAEAFRYEDFIRNHTDKRPNPYLTIASLMTQCDAVGEGDLKEFPDFFLLVWWRGALQMPTEHLLSQLDSHHTGSCPAHTQRCYLQSQKQEKYINFRCCDWLALQGHVRSSWRFDSGLNIQITFVHLN